MYGVEPLLQRGNRPRRVLEFRLRWYRLFDWRSKYYRVVEVRRLRFDLAGELRHRLLQIRIVLGERERSAVLRERRRQIAVATVDFAETADRGEVLGCAPENERQLGLRFCELI